MRWVRKLFFALLQASLRRWAVRKTERSLLLWYLKSLQVIRRGAIGILLLIFIFQIFSFCFVGLVVTGVLLLVEDPQTRLWILFGGSATFFFLVSILLYYLLSDRLWYKLANVDSTLEKLNSEAV